MPRKHGNEQIQVDFPQFNERITSPHYTFRIQTNVSGPVEVSVDDGPWTPCRESVGYWWFDYAGGEPGRHQLIARVHSPNGELQSDPRAFVVGQEPVQGQAPGRKRAGRI